jgi:protein-S-isoprenylcysteine O-methyltransferase Ste14
MSEEKDNPGIITHPPVFYIAAVLISIGLNRLYALSLGDYEILETLAIVIASASIIILVMATKLFKDNSQSPSVHATSVKIYTGGVYGYSRNPIYVGATSLLIAAALYFSNGWMLISVLPILYIMTNLVIIKEEVYLEEKFGQEYMDYKKKVRRWI